MNFLIEYSFLNKSFVLPLFEMLRKNTVITQIEYNANFEWKPVSTEQVENLTFDQLRIKTDRFGTINIQCLNNAFPRVFGVDFTSSNKDSFSELIEFNFWQLIVYARVCDSTDDMLQNNERLDSWRRKNRLLPSSAVIVSNALKTNEREKEIISLESLPGHHHQMDYDEKLWFGSCWQMYFSTAYYKYIPKPLFDDFLDCFENRVVNNLRKITLFENPQDFDLPENRLSQWKFRRAVGIDSIAHELMKSNNRIEPDFLPVLITKKNCVAGETRVSRYLDTSGNLVASNDASVIEIKEYLVDGTTVVFEETVKNN